MSMVVCKLSASCVYCLTEYLKANKAKSSGLKSVTLYYSSPSFSSLAFYYHPTLIIFLRMRTKSPHLSSDRRPNSQRKPDCQYEIQSWSLKLSNLTFLVSFELLRRQRICEEGDLSTNLDKGSYIGHTSQLKLHTFAIASSKHNS